MVAYHQPNNGRGLAALSSDTVRQYFQEEQAIRANLFSHDEISKILRYGAIVGNSIEFHAEARRCMDLARNSISRHEAVCRSYKSGTVILAEKLTAGKGRFARKWHAPKGGVWLSLVLVNTLLSENGSFLPLAAGVACCETIRHYGIPANVKWANDVHVGGRKVAGILTETMVGPSSSEEYILIGIGLNVNNKKFPQELSANAAGMRDFVSYDLDLVDVASRLLAKLSWNIGLLHFQEEAQLAQVYGCGSDEAYSPFMESFRLLSDTVGQKVRYGFNVVSSPQYNAEVLAVNDCGALVMKLSDGTIITESGGEIQYL